jgi:hypothetical protein
MKLSFDCIDFIVEKSFHYSINPGVSIVSLSLSLPPSLSLSLSLSFSRF